MDFFNKHKNKIKECGISIVGSSVIFGLGEQVVKIRSAKTRNIAMPLWQRNRLPYVIIGVTMGSFMGHVSNHYKN